MEQRSQKWIDPLIIYSILLPRDKYKLRIVKNNGERWHAKEHALVPRSAYGERLLLSYCSLLYVLLLFACNSKLEWGPMAFRVTNSRRSSCIVIATFLNEMFGNSERYFKFETLFFGTYCDQQTIWQHVLMPLTPLGSCATINHVEMKNRKNNARAHTQFNSLLFSLFSRNCRRRSEREIDPIECSNTLNTLFCSGSIELWLNIIPK